MNGSSQGSDTKEQHESPLLVLAHLELYDLWYGENEDYDVFDDTENCSADSNSSQVDAFTRNTRVPNRFDGFTLKAHCQNVGDTMQCEENNAEFTGYRKPSTCKYSEVK